MLPLHSSSNEIAEPDSLWAFWAAVEVLPAIAVASALFLYLFGVYTLTKRGDAWPIGRTLSFCIGGMGSIYLATQGPLAALDTVLIWTHMVQHMILTMIAPIFLALGAPITLLLRTAPQWIRKVVLAVLHSWYGKFVTFPLVAGGIFIINPWILYYTDFYELTLTNPLVHNLNHLHFLVVGCVWIWALIGIDPMPRMGHPLRLFAVFLTLPFHAFLGLSLMSAPTTIGGGFYETVVRQWGPTVAQDQEIAGGLLWAAGDLVGLMLFVVLMIQWAKASDREAARIDRELDRQEQLNQSDLK
ncbi:MAG: hypothetical protein RIS75_583 [Actinomycetota bacterium]